MKKAKCPKCADLILNLGNKPYFESVSPEGLIQLADTLHDYGHKNAEAIINEALIKRFGENGADRVPSSSDLWALCRMDPLDFESAGNKPSSGSKEANPKCPLCAGTGWKLITRRGDEYVDRCCGAPPAFDPTKPPKTPTASLSEIEQLRQDNQRFAAELARDLAGKTSKPAEIPTATEADITAILAEQARNRKEKHREGCDCLACMPQTVGA